MTIRTKQTRGKKQPRKAEKGEAQLCIASVYAYESRNILPIEIDFPQISKAEDTRIMKALEELVRRLGYKPLWVPII